MVVEHQVFWLEVAVDDALCVQIFERFDDARYAEPRRCVIKVTERAVTQRHLSSSDNAIRRRYLVRCVQDNK